MSTLQRAAVDFAARAADDEDFTFRGFVRALRAYVTARRIVYPEDRTSNINESQCIAVARRVRLARLKGR